MYTDEEIAQVCYEANRVLQRINGEEPGPSWEQAPQWMKDSVVDGVVYAMNTSVTPEQLHQNWVDYRASNGWVYGPEKDEVAKTHPCMVSYADLPPSQRVKDRVFRSIVQTLIDVF